MVGQSYISPSPARVTWTQLQVPDRSLLAAPCPRRWHPRDLEVGHHRPRPRPRPRLLRHFHARLGLQLPTLVQRLVTFDLDCSRLIKSSRGVGPTVPSPGIYIPSSFLAATHHFFSNSASTGWAIRHLAGLRYGVHHSPACVPCPAIAYHPF